MHNSKLHSLPALFYATLCLAIIPTHSQAANIKHKAVTKERVVLMPLRVPEEDKNLTGAMEVALVEGLQQRYDVFSGEQVSQKARQIFLKETRNVEHVECDEILCLQGIAETFQSELIATANVTKQDGIYFLSLSIQNVFDNKVVYSKSSPCKNCDMAQVVDELKKLSFTMPPPLSAASVEGVGKVFKDCADCPEMVVIPQGSFAMGSSASEVGREAVEGPQHHITINAFSMGRVEVTVGEFRNFIQSTHYKTDAERNAAGASGCYVLDLSDGRLNWRIGYYWDKPGFNQTDKHPVVCVSRSDAIAYVKWLVQKTGKKYRLPSEAEWEYAARGNTDTARYWGEDTKVACRYANVADMTSGHQGIGRIVKHECSDNYFFTAPVGSFLPNAFGLYDMLGNAAEWVADNYHNSYRFAPTDGSVWQGSDAWGGILRGGSWNDIPQDVRSSTRIRNDSTLRYSGGGFRISKTLP